VKIRLLTILAVLGALLTGTPMRAQAQTPVDRPEIEGLERLSPEDRDAAERQL